MNENKGSYILFPLLLVCYEIITYFSTDAYVPALPQMAQELFISQRQAELTITLWFLGAATTQLFLGPISDRYGRRPVLLLGGLTFIIATLICAATSNIDILLSARCLQGMSITALVVSGYATIHELYDEKRVIHILAIMTSVTVLAPALGPLVGSTLLYVTNWRGIFGVLGAAAIILIVGLFYKMPETNMEGSKHPIEVKRISSQYYRILTNRNFLFNTLTECLLFAAFATWITAGPFLVIAKFHHGPIWFGIYQALIFIFYIIGAHSVKPLMQKYNINYLVKIGLGVALAGSVLAVVLAIINPYSLLGFLISMMIYSLGAGLSFPILNRLVIQSSPEPMGSRVAMLSSLTSLFGVMGSSIISIFYHGRLISLAALICIFCALAFVVKYFILKK